MNEEQFLLLQEAVQWAADQHDREWLGMKQKGLYWDQSQWFEGKLLSRTKKIGSTKIHFISVACGSSCCVAGNVTTLVGAKPVLSEVDKDRYSQYHGEHVATGTCLTKDGRVMEIPLYAIEVLGVTEQEANSLFSGNNDIDKVIRKATHLARKYGFKLEIHRKTDGRPA